LRNISRRYVSIGTLGRPIRAEKCGPNGAQEPLIVQPGIDTLQLDRQP
jgi:hypothetical protein